MFHISADGIVSVKARDLETGLEQSITVTATSGLTEDEIKKMVEANKDYMVEVKSHQEFDKARHAAEKALEEIESLFPQVTDIIAGSDFGQDAVKKARAVVDRTRTAIAAKDLTTLTEATEALNRTLNMFRGVVSKTRG
jgi:molecular chaperone DnaK